jgi:anti-sigma B factor antagonist
MHPMSPGDTFEISNFRHGDAVVLQPSGDIDLSRSPLMRKRISEAAAAKPSRVVIDLSKVPYMDSSGVATLVEALQHARRGGWKLVLCDLHPKVRSIFQIAKLESVFTIVADRDAAATA